MSENDSTTTTTTNDNNDDDDTQQPRNAGNGNNPAMTYVKDSENRDDEPSASSSASSNGDDENTTASNANDDSNGKSNDASSSSLLAEAERQAAIAAALSQTCSNSPSVVAGLARQLAAGSAGGPYGPTVVALPPLSSAAVGGDVAAGGGTSGAGPASRLATPVPLPVAMKPVRFDHVKIVFEELLREESDPNDGREIEVEDEEEDEDMGGEKRRESQSAVVLPDGDAVTSGAHEDPTDSSCNEQLAEDNANDGNESSEETVVSTKSNEQREELESQSAGDMAVAQNMTATDSNTDASSLSSSSSSSSSTTTTTTNTQQSPSTSTIPESFLRFLLLVARVPIIVEEGKKKQLHRQKKRLMANSQANALAAAKRIMEIYKCAQDCYQQIEAERRNKRARGGRDNGQGEDATAAFFASCSGETSGNNELGANGSRYEDASQNHPTHHHNHQQPSSSKQYKTKQRSSFATNNASSSAPSSAAVTAMVSASSIFSNVISKVSKKQHTSLSDIGKKIMSGNVSLHKENDAHASSPRAEGDAPTQDYEIIIDQEMLGLTVENVLERTIIRTLLPEGAAKRAGAKVGSLIAKVGNVDTSNLTHFETIDELRQSQRPLKLTLRHVRAEVLRCAREEMGRLIRGREEEGGGANRILQGDKPWRDGSHHGASGGGGGKTKETLDSILRDRWPSKIQRTALVPTAATTPSIMTRAEMMHRAGKDLMRILTLMVVGMEKELFEWNAGCASSSSLPGSLSSADVRRKQLAEGIEITSKILLEYARKHPDVNEKFKSDKGSGSSLPSTSFYPVPPGRVGKKNAHTPPPSPGGKSLKNKKGPDDSPLLRIGDALQRTMSFLVEPSSITATTLRWEIIDYLCVVLDLDSENELAEKEAASSTSQGGDASQITDLGSAGSILKLIVVNCSTTDNDSSSPESGESIDEESLATFGQSSSGSSGRSSYSGNPFISVVHRLAASKSTSARVSACSLGPVLWSHLDFPRQLQLRGVITRALHDVEMTVRKSTATVLHEVAELVFDRRSVPWLVLMCERSMTDPEPQLRAAAMTLTWHLAEHLPNAFLGDASKGSRSLRRLPPRTDPTFMDVYLLQCKLLPVASNLAEDKMPSVRLSVAAQCDRLCSAMGEHWFSVIIDLLQALLSDGDERVRSEAVLCMPRLVESVVVGTSKGQNITVLESLLPQAFKIQTDPSPEVRSALATATGDLLIFLVGAEDNNNETAPPSPGRGALATPSVYKKYVDDTLIPILQKLLQDSSPEVTTASLRAVTNASRSSTVGSTTRIPPTTHNFDSIDDDVASISSHQSFQSHTSYDRRKPVFIPVLSEEQVLRLLPTLSNLATSKEWRVRQSAVEIVPALLGCTYRHETRQEISKFCLKLMSDKVDAVRKTAAECLCLGGSSLARHGEDDGGAWITNTVIPHLKTCSQSEDSKQRLLCLKMIEIIITNGLCPAPHRKADSTSKLDISLNSSFDTASESVCDAESPAKLILDIAAPLASDKVANVRLNVGRVFGSIIPLLDRPEADLAMTILEKQLVDEKSRAGGGDRDVIYFSQQAILLLQSPRRLSSYEGQHFVD